MRRGALALFLCACVLPSATPALAAGPALGFAPAQFLDDQLAGGEPIVFADTVHHTLIYSAHEGTTHLYRPGFTSATPVSWLANYRNQVNIWVSKDNGATWTRSINNQFNGTDPTKSNGFSDPDLTQDEGGRVYDTGINLASDSLFSTADGGLTWDKGTAQCHDGDRPWLAGGKKDEVWLATDVLEGDPNAPALHTIFHSTDGGQTCSTQGVTDYGSTPDGGQYYGFGKLLYDHQRKMLIEPVVYADKDGTTDAIGASTGTPNADESYKMTAKKVADLPNGTVEHWPTVAEDTAGNVYLVWDTNERQKGTTTGCSQAEAPLANSIMMASSKDFGQTWSKPITVAHVDGHRVLWPWITAGAAGRVGIIYYQQNNLADIDCQNADISVMATSISGADTDSPQITTVDAVGRPVAKNTTICQGGTTCVATGQDRRLGDYMTISLDPNGCEMIATGDVTKPDPVTGMTRQTSLPLFVHQNSGPSLTGGSCGGAAAAPGPAPTGSSCAKPTSRAAGRGANRAERLAVHGTACGKVARVEVAVGRLVGSRCSFMRASGRFTPARSCGRRLYLRAKGTKRWTLNGTGELPNGRYRIWIRAVDAQGHKERAHRAGGFRIT
jgi:hypothetical protein